MDYLLLGSSGLRVSQLCLGAMTFGSDEPWCADKAESRAMFDAYVAAGGNFIDTADIYTGGESEKLVGEFIADDRERFVVATKYTNSFPGPNDPNASGNHRKNLTQSLDASLKRLNVDYIDLYWVHVWDYTTPVDEVIRALDDAVRAGKILYIGLSDAPAWVCSRANTIAELRGWTPFVTMQLEYSLLERGIEREHFSLCRAADIAITAWSPLASGALSGKYTRGGDEARRLDVLPFKTLDEDKLTVAREVDAVADEIGVSSAQVALAWVRQRGTIPIIGARTLAQLEDNLASVELSLSDEQMERLNSASAIDLGHPYNFTENELVRDLVYGGMHGRVHNHRPLR
ncbi:MAG: aldo/keto reductase [Halieaceae bacterium]|jgi:aryl-alcohol dehydrogenase-like predicted oxidoreductase|nr:aldo/keto reductase [Halieaceae bacterium]